MSTLFPKDYAASEKLAPLVRERGSCRGSAEDSGEF